MIAWKDGYWAVMMTCGSLSWIVVHTPRGDVLSDPGQVGSVLERDVEWRFVEPQLNVKGLCKRCQRIDPPFVRVRLPPVPVEPVKPVAFRNKFSRRK